MDKMKCILVGYPASQKIVPASKYLVGKYLPFKVHWLNWVGELNGWSNFVATYLAHLDCEKVVFALDDYLVSGFNQEIFDKAVKEVKLNTVAVKLCETTPEEHESYPVTTQYTIWDRQFLIDLLTETTTPWDFEIRGSQIFRNIGTKSLYGFPAIKYDVHSCLSSRWEGVKWDGVKEEDLNIIKQL